MCLKLIVYAPHTHTDLLKALCSYSPCLVLHDACRSTSVTTLSPTNSLNNERQFASKVSGDLACCSYPSAVKTITRLRTCLQLEKDSLREDPPNSQQRVIADTCFKLIYITLSEELQLRLLWGSLCLIFIKCAVCLNHRLDLLTYASFGTSVAWTSKDITMHVVVLAWYSVPFQREHCCSSLLVLFHHCGKGLLDVLRN